MQDQEVLCCHYLGAKVPFIFGQMGKKRLRKKNASKKSRISKDTLEKLKSMKFLPNGKPNPYYQRPSITAARNAMGITPFPLQQGVLQSTGSNEKDKKLMDIANQNSLLQKKVSSQETSLKAMEDQNKERRYVMGDF